METSIHYCYDCKEIVMPEDMAQHEGHVVVWTGWVSWMDEEKSRKIAE